jgi:hypothetical protein
LTAAGSGFAKTRCPTSGEKDVDDKETNVTKKEKDKK